MSKKCEHEIISNWEETESWCSVCGERTDSICFEYEQELAALRAWKEKASPILQCVVWDTDDVTRFTIEDKGELARQLLED